MSDSLLLAALEYAERGWAVLPLHGVAEGGCTCGKSDCSSPGKHPRTLRGVHDASTDPERIRQWWAAAPWSNIGIATGAASGLVVLDIDGPEGESHLDIGWSIPTPCSITGRGRHLYFRAAPGSLPNAAHFRAQLDLRGDGGYVVAPPSTHVSGSSYRWDTDNGMGPDLEPAEIPASLIAAVGKLPSPTRPASKGSAIPEGQRNTELTRMAGSLLGTGYSESDTLRQCLEANNLRCSPPLPESEVRQIVGSISKRESAKQVGERHGSTNEWPAPLGEAAFHGLAGEVVRTLLPHTESDPAALLIQFLTAFGSAVGRKPHFSVEASRHGLNLFTLITGNTAKGRKGTSWAQTKQLFQEADSDWCNECITSGLSSGEGLIWAVRDPDEEASLSGPKALAREGEPGGIVTPRKRLLVVETEFGAALRLLGRDGNILSPIIRQAWDDGCLRVMNKNSPVRATDAHISIIGHITRDELLRHLKHSDVLNGFLNRFLLICVRRSKCLPEGGNLEPAVVSRLATRIGDTLRFGREIDRLTKDREATALWARAYPELTSDRPGMLGAVTSRADPQVMRLACLYALLDTSSEIRVEHLEAAVAVWRYAEASARFIFGDALRDPSAEKILEALAAAPDGLSRTEIRDLFGRHDSQTVTRALETLGASQLAHRRDYKGTGGRPEQRWYSGATKAT